MKKLAFLLALALSASASASPTTPSYELRVYTPGTLPSSGAPATPPASNLPTAVIVGGTDFGTVRLGQTQGLLATLKNTSATLPLNITGIGVTGAGVTHGTQGNCPAYLAASASCTIDLYWAPLTVGALSGALTISDNEAGGGQSIPLTGNAVLPSASSSITGTSAFGSVVVGTSGTLTYTIQNTSAYTPLQLGAISVNNGAVTWSPGSSGTACGTTLAPNASCTIDVTWAPTAAGSLTGTSLSIIDSSSTTPHTYALTGTATLPTPVSTITGTPAFGTVVVGSTGTVTYTIQNTSAYTPLQLSAVTLNNGAISWVPGKTGTPCTKPLPQTLAPNTSCTIDVTWGPTAIGSLTGATLSITDNASATPHVYNLSGTAIGPADPYFAQVTVLLPFEGTGDIKGNPVTSAGTTLATSVVHSGATSAGYSSSIGVWAKVDTTAPFDFAGDFTIEGWVYPVNSTTTHVWEIGGVENVNWQSQSLWIAGGRFIYNASSANVTNDIAANLDIGAATIGAWNHFAITRNGAVYRTFINGQLTKTISVNKRPYKAPYGLLLGNYPTNSWTNMPYSWGAKYIDDFRVTNGVARYTTNFTPSSQPFPTR